MDSFLSGHTLISTQTSLIPKIPFPISWNSNQQCSFKTTSTFSPLIVSYVGFSQSFSSHEIQWGSFDSLPFWSIYLSPIFKATEIQSSRVTCIFEMMQFSFEQIPNKVILFEEIFEKVRMFTYFSKAPFQSSIFTSRQNGIHLILLLSFQRSSDC